MSSKVNSLIAELERASKKKRSSKKGIAKRSVRTSPKQKVAAKKTTKQRAAKKTTKQRAAKKTSKNVQWRGTAPANMTHAQRLAWAASMQRARKRKAKQ